MGLTVQYRGGKGAPFPPPVSFPLLSPPPLGNRGPPDVGSRYRYEHLKLGPMMEDLSFRKDDPGPGDRVPDVDLPTPGGGRFRSSDLGETRPVLLIFGSYTCPQTSSSAPGLKELHARYGDRVRFVMVDVREAGPGRSVPQPATSDQKTEHAEWLRDLYGFEFEVAVDDIDGTLHRSLSPKPNSAYVLDKDGTILFRAQWANDTKALASALDATAAGKSVTRSHSGGLVRPVLHALPHIAPAIDRGGSGSRRDLWVVAPPLAAIAFAFKVLHVRPR